MKLFSWNVNGIRAVQKKGLLIPFIEKYQPDILCLQETKAQPDQIELDLPDYHMFWNSAQKKGYSSTGILTKSKPIQTINGLPSEIVQKYKLSDEYGDTGKEGRVTTVEFDDFFVVTVYTPNSKGDLSRLRLRHEAWDPAFLDFVRKLEDKKPVIFCGDLNVAHKPEDLARPKENEGKHGYTKEEREGFDKFLQAGFIDSFRMFTKGSGHYSWWTHWANARERNIGWRIDYFLISEKLRYRVKSASIHPEIVGSDHCPVSIEVTDEE